MAAQQHSLATSTDSQQSRVRAAWLFSPRIDLAILVVPALFTLAMVAYAHHGGDPLAREERAFATWVAQFILGNTTHVLLTFLLLGVRRDVLTATPRQAHIVIFGSLAACAVAFAFFWATSRSYPALIELGTAVGLTFATHHRLSQVKGIWSLYNLRGNQAKLPAPDARERKVVQLFVPIGLLLTLVKWFFVEKRADSSYPFINALPGEPAFLPYAVTWVLLAAWALFAFFVVRALLLPAVVSGPKLLYIAAQLTAVALTIVSPGWGLTFAAGVHGLEYFFLAARMLEPTKHETSARLRGGWIWPAILLTVLPFVVIGTMTGGPSFFSGYLGASAGAASVLVVLSILMNSVVVAHYFADAFIYRFRIPEVRKVALTRLGFL
ncbi:MAG: hypothetical protein JWM74_4448 [Myxococcaceae bacterium]|nr:hypothetical protein [Myxococcaceae bacterium]